MHTKGIYHTAKGLSRIGCVVLRFNFRGIGKSEGVWDEGEGEKADFRAALDFMAAQYPGVPLWAGGMSFGSWVGMNVGVEDPHDSSRVLAALALNGRALATSADNRSIFSADRRHHHIIDPSTGDSPPELSSVTVVAASAMRADALTKVMFMAGPGRIPALARQWDVGVLWVDKQGQWEATPGLLPA